MKNKFSEVIIPKALRSYVQKHGRLSLRLAYKQYIEENRAHWGTGWQPVCYEEFLGSEWLENFLAES